MAKKWIKGATENKGALHRNLGVPEGETIPADKLKKAENSSNPKIAKEAHLAETLKSMHKKPKKTEPKAKTDPLTAMYGAKSK